MHRFFEQFADFIFPPLCLHCQYEGQWLCAAARQEIAKLPILIDPLPIDGVDRVLCRGDYDHPMLGQSIQRIKYNFWTAPAGEVFPLLLTPLLADLSTGATIVPIPLHWRRRMSRGFNQSELLAATLASLTNQPVVHLLQRHRFTTPQAKLNGQQRLANVRGAFQVKSVAKMPNSVILVDDVITTGSTIRECASVLRQAGVKTIIAVALAKG